MEVLVGLKYEKVLAIYNWFVEAKGDWCFLVLVFVMIKAVNNVVFLVYGGIQIGLEEKVYDICMLLGEQEGEVVIVGLFGYELVYFYEKYQWWLGFVKVYQELEIGRIL